MQFIYPNFLWALSFLAIPVIIHLFYFRRFKKVYFTNVKFLKEIKEETSSRNKLKNLLVLLMRLLAMACLVFAFAQAYISDGQDIKSGSKGVSIFIDNSFSMSAESDEESLLQHAKKKAIEISEAYGESDKIQILNSDFEGRHQRFVSDEEARGLIDEMSPSAESRNISSVVNRQKQAFKSDAFDNEIIYIISDFQKSITDAVDIDTSMSVNLVPLQAIKESNVAIDSVYLDSGVAMLNQSNKLNAIIHNYADETIENIRISLNLDNQDKPVETISLEPNQSIEIEISLTPTHTGWHQAYLKITDYPITFDDIYRFSFYVNEEVNILSVNQDGPNTYLNAVFKELSFFKINNTSINQIQYNEFSGQDLIILNDLSTISSGLQSELRQYIESGGKVLIFPSSSADINSYNQFLNSLKSDELKRFDNNRKEVGSINQNEFVFEGVFEDRQNANIKLPITTGQFELNNYQNRSIQSILKYRDGTSYLYKTDYQDGYLYMCAAPLNKNFNDLVLNAEIFVPMLYKMALSNGKGVRLAYTIGEDRLIRTDIQRSSASEHYTMSGPLEFIPGQYNAGKSLYLDLSDQVKEAGFYELRDKQELLAVYAFNYNKKESTLDYNNVDELKKLYGDQVKIIDEKAKANFTQIIQENEKGISLWRWFLIAALLFLLIEQILIRLLKT